MSVCVCVCVCVCTEIAVRPPYVTGGPVMPEG